MIFVIINSLKHTSMKALKLQRMYFLNKPLITILLIILTLSFGISQDIKIKNKTRFSLAVTVKYLDYEDDWVKRHLVIPSYSSRKCCHTDNKIIYYYAVDTHGYGWQIYGHDSYGMNSYNTYVGFRKKRLKSNFLLTLTE